MDGRVPALLALTVLLTSAATAVWSINDVEQPASLDTVSNNTTTKQLVRLLDNNNEPVEADQLKYSGWNFTYNYTNTTHSWKRADMEYLTDGYWYADLRPNTTAGKLWYTLMSDDPGDPVISKTETLDIGNITVNTLTDFSPIYKANRPVFVEVELTDEWNDVEEDQANLDLYFTNGSWSSSIVNLGYNDGRYTNRVDLPKKTNASYIVHINATYPGATYSNAYGSESFRFNTYPAIEGEIKYFNSSYGCNNQSFADTCEQGASISTGFNITAASAKNVNLSVINVERDTGEWVTRLRSRMNHENGLYTLNITLPDINTTRFRKKYVLEYNATNDRRTFIKRRNLSYRTYTMRDASEPNAYRGSTHEVRLAFEKPFTHEPYDASRFDNVTVNVTDPSGDLFQQFTLSDMSYSIPSGVFTYDLFIPSGAEVGTYDLYLEAFNIYTERKTLDSGFQLQSTQATFETSGDISESVSSTGPRYYNFTVTGKTGSENVLEFDLSDSIEDFTEVNTGEDLTLQGSEEREVPFLVNISRVRDISGSIKIIDQGVYNRTISVNLAAPDCGVRNGTLCVQRVTEGWLNVTRDERGTTTRELTVIHLGAPGEEPRVNTETSGEAFDHVVVEPQTFSLDGSTEVTLNYTATVPGISTGTLSFYTPDNRVEIHTRFNSSVTAQDTGMNINDSIDLGYVPKGASKTVELLVENTGNVPINTLTADSGDYTVSISSTPLEPGESTTVSLDIQDITGEGTVTVTGTTSQGDIQKKLDVRALAVPDYTQRSSRLKSRINELTSRAESQNIKTRLQELHTEISAMETAYQRGNYQQAKLKYQSIRNTLDSLESQISTGTGTQPDKQGGTPVLPVAAAVFVMILLGFVAYTSLIPEEGDPLYSVLGR